MGDGKTGDNPMPSTTQSSKREKGEEERGAELELIVDVAKGQERGRWATTK